jgi:hypothetical protein
MPNAPAPGNTAVYPTTLAEEAARSESPQHNDEEGAATSDEEYQHALEVKLFLHTGKTWLIPCR